MRLSLLFIASLFLAACGNEPEVTHGQFLAFGTINEVSICCVSEERANKAIASVEKEFAELHQIWHAWEPGPLTKGNDLISAGSSFAAPAQIIDLTRISIDLSEKSHNLFNPAIGHLIRLWGFQKNAFEGQQPPPDDQLQALIEHNPRMSDLEIKGQEIVSHNPWVKLDFGAIGKGYGVDLALRHLREQGIENAIVNSGGNLKAVGSKQGKPWRIGIRHPSGEGSLGILELSGNEAVVTSGDYERYFIWNGRKYGHIIDPRTGYPASDTRSVTVLHPDAATADAASTALFIAGPTQWHEVARSMGIGYVLLVDVQGVIHMNPEMAARVHLSDPEAKIQLSPPLN